MNTSKDIPREVALKLCDEIRGENKQKWFSLAKMQCWGCCKWSKGDLEKMCLSSEGGCNLVNKRYSLLKERK